MVALIIFGVTASAIALANAQTLTGARQIEEQTEARWVNLNYLAQMRIEKQLPDAGTRTVDVEFNSKSWEIEIEVNNVEVDVIGPFLRHVQLKAKLEGDDNFADILIAVLGEANI
jgi:general secretion pathway protein I